MRIPIFLLLPAAIFTFTSGCRDGSAELLHEKPVGQPTLELPDAMTMLFGNFDVKTQSSTALMEDKSATKHDRKPMIVRSLFRTGTIQAGEQRLVLVTYSVPRGETFDCHQCSPTIGMAVFSQSQRHWSVEASDASVTESGSWGRPPTNVQLLQIGPERQAIQIREVYRGGGETTTILQVLVPWKGGIRLGLYRVISDDDLGGCGDPELLPCYSNRRTLNFIPMGEAEYYDVELRLAGTDLPESDTLPANKARVVRGLEILTFQDGKYVRASRRGDVTSEDHFVGGGEDVQ